MRIKKDLMTPKERMQAFEKGQPIDRIPCTPSMGVTLSSMIGRNASEYYHSAELMAELEIVLFKRFGHDSAGVGLSREIAEAMGTKVIYPRHGISYAAEPAIKDINDIARLAPLDPLKDGKIPISLRAVKMVKEALGKLVNVGYSIPGPLTTASDLLGTEELLKSMIKNPDRTHELLEIVTESNFRILDIIAEMEIGFRIADPVSSSSLISTKLFREFSMPYLKKCVDRMRRKGDRGTSFHICGRSKPIWDGIVETGVVSLSIDNIEDMEEVKKAVGEQVCIVGNVPPVDIVRYGSYEDVVRESKQCIMKAYDSPRGFILGTGCQVPINSPVENIQALMDTVRSYGVYPVRPDLW